MRETTHPGEILQKEFVEPLKLSHRQLADALGVSQASVSRLCGGKSSLSVEMAIRLAKHFGTSDEFWMNLHVAHELSRIRPTLDLSRVEARASA